MVLACASVIDIVPLPAAAHDRRSHGGEKGRNRREQMRSGKQTVGIVGLGIMGGAFARNLVAWGFRVIGFDGDPARGRAARRARVEIAADAAALAARAPVVITSLPHPAAIIATVAAIAAAKLPRRV